VLIGIAANRKEAGRRAANWGNFINSEGPSLVGIKNSEGLEND
jgi:hypothetical protein